MTTVPPPHEPAGGPPPESDETLVARVARGDRAAFEALYHRHAAAVMSFVHHLTFDRHVAEDATQEVFVKVWKAAHRFREGARFTPWLFRIARNTAWNEAPRRRLRALGGEGAAGLPREAAGADVDAAAGDSEAAVAARAAVTSLSEALRTAFVLVRMEGRSLEETAEVLEVPVGTVKSRVAAAEAALRERLRGSR
jgi:RNA polymerase sigma-70 factor, ECF subfamily